MLLGTRRLARRSAYSKVITERGRCSKPDDTIEGRPVGAPQSISPTVELWLEPTFPTRRTLGLRPRSRPRRSRLWVEATSGVEGCSCARALGTVAVVSEVATNGGPTVTRVYVPLDKNMTPAEIVAALKEASTVARADTEELKAAGEGEGVAESSSDEKVNE